LLDALIGLFKLSCTYVTILNLTFKASNAGLHCGDSELVLAADLLVILVWGSARSTPT
jgi:hypothetical protein